MRVQTDLKAWPPFGSTTAGAASLQFVIELLRDQSFFEQGLVPAHLLPSRRLAKEPVLESRYVVGVLPTKGVQGIAHVFPTLPDDLLGDLG